MTRKNRFRALLNLTVAAALLFAVWLMNGAPIPQQLRAANMRREERENLLPRSEIVWRHRTTGWDSDILVGVTPTAVYTYCWGVKVWTRDPDGPTLVVLPSHVSYTAGVGGTYGLLAVDPPSGAESARLTVMLEYQYDNIEGALYSEEYREESVRDGACFLFPLTWHHRDLEDSLYKPESVMFSIGLGTYADRGYFTAPYTLEFFDGAGNLILSCGNQT